MIKEIMGEIKKEARQGVVTLTEGDVSVPLRVSFNIVDNYISDTIPNIFIKDNDSFNLILTDYVSTVLEFYKLEVNYRNIKEILTYSIVNITKKEMNCLEDYLKKYINFYKSRFISISGKRSLDIGTLKYKVEKQSLKQETPYCFKSYFEKNESKYALPRISFGINNGVCYVYAIQNKDSKINTDPNYNLEVKNKLRSINSGITKYRNVTPSFVISLILFISFLRENGINRINVVTPLPIRQANREASEKERIKFYSMQGSLSKDEIEKFKNEIIDKRIMDDYNSTVKFVNCFNRLKLHFDNLFLSNINNDIILDILNLTTDNEFLSEIVKEKER